MKKTPSSLARKLFLSFVVSFLLPMLLISALVSYLFGTRQYREINNQADNNLTLISAYISKYINDIDNITKAPYYHSYFQSKASLDSLSPYDQNQVSKEIGQLLQLTTYSRDDFGDLVVMSDEKVLYFNSTDWYQYLPTISPLTEREWYQAALQREGRVAVVPADSADCGGNSIDTSNFYLSRKLNNMFYPQQTNIIMINLKTTALDALLGSLSSTAPLMVLFTNDDEKLIYANQNVDQTLIDTIHEPTLEFENRTWKTFSQTLEDYPLTVHVLLDTSYVTRQITVVILASLICYAVGISIAYLLFRRNNRLIKEPTYHLKTTLKELEGGNLTARCQPLPVKEFDEIGSSINMMAFQLQEKIKNEYELSIAQKSLQFEALQSQIQPHFIINTIYSFITLNQIGEQELLNDAFYSFARLLRYVLSKDSQTTLGRELDFLNNYCSLCALRFGNRLAYEVTCDEALAEIKMPKLLLQPLVENAVIHGIEPSETPCQLTVYAVYCEETLYLVIEDDGVGFEPSRLSSPDSIGIKNVEHRLSLWNSRASLQIHRISGTTIQILTFPPNNNTGG